MNFLETLGAFADTEILADGSFCKIYFGLPRWHWDRIKQVAIDLDHAGIGPKVTSINDSDMEICYHQVQPLNCQMQRRDVYDTYGMTVKEIQKRITNLVDILHSLDYAHGDLHMDNIGFKDGKFYLLDCDTIYRISQGEVPWIKQWIEKCFGEEFSFDEFVNYDYDNWKTDWLF